MVLIRLHLCTLLRINQTSLICRFSGVQLRFDMGVGGRPGRRTNCWPCSELSAGGRGLGRKVWEHGDWRLREWVHFVVVVGGRS